VRRTSGHTAHSAKGRTVTWLQPGAPKTRSGDEVTGFSDLDLNESPLSPPGAVVERIGSLSSGLHWSGAADLLRTWATNPAAHASRPEDARCSSGFEVSVDRDGRTIVAVADQVAAARLSRLVATSAAVSARPEPPAVVQTLRDEPAVKDRAVMECFYGPLWTPDDRRDVIERATGHGANTYVYGPAADLRTGEAWRSPYAGQSASDLERLVDDAHRRGMEVVWRVSPGAPLDRSRAIGLSDADEVRTLLSRVGEVVDLGFDRVLVGFDDIDTDLDAAARATFGDDPHPAAAAQATLLNAVSASLAERGVPVLACPTHYWGVRPSAYRRRLGELLSPDIAVCWTGSGVVSSSITAAQVHDVTEQFQHRVWLWDNFPVNDWDATGEAFTNDMSPRRLPLTALVGRASGVADTIVGYGSNAALQPHAGLPAVCTALDWAWGPGGYDADVALRHALSETGVHQEALSLLADTVGAVAGGARGNALLATTCARLLATDGVPAGRLVRIAHARDVVRQHAAAASVLEAAPGALGREIAPWVQELGRVCRATLLALDVLEAYGVNQEVVDERSQQLRDQRPPVGGVSIASGLLDNLVDYARGFAAGGAPVWPG